MVIIILVIIIIVIIIIIILLCVLYILRLVKSLVMLLWAIIAGGCWYNTNFEFASKAIRPALQ